jgi:hypothetical protein
MDKWVVIGYEPGETANKPPEPRNPQIQRNRGSGNPQIREYTDPKQRKAMSIPGSRRYRRGGA